MCCSSYPTSTPFVHGCITCLLGGLSPVVLYYDKSLLSGDWLIVLADGLKHLDSIRRSSLRIIPSSPRELLLAQAVIADDKVQFMINTRGFEYLAKPVSLRCSIAVSYTHLTLPTKA